MFTYLQMTHITCFCEPSAHGLGHFSIACLCSSHPFVGDVKYINFSSCQSHVSQPFL